MYNRGIQETTTTKENIMTSYEKAIAEVKEMVKNGSTLREAIKDVASEFGFFEAELWEEF